MTYEDIYNVIDLCIIKKISKELKEKKIQILEKVEKKFYLPFSIDGLYEYHTTITKKKKMKKMKKTQIKISLNIKYKIFYILYNYIIIIRC